MKKFINYSNKMKSKQERIKDRAYQIYKIRIKHRIPGDAVSDWKQAEDEIEVEDLRIKSYVDMGIERN